jgi:hypothetical protein
MHPNLLKFPTGGLFFDDHQQNERAKGIGPKSGRPPKRNFAAGPRLQLLELPKHGRSANSQVFLTPLF